MVKYCKCGCNQEITSNWGNNISYIKGHARKGKSNSINHNILISKANFKSIGTNCCFCNNKIFVRPAKINKYKNHFCNKKCYDLFKIGKPRTKESIEKRRLKVIGHKVSPLTRQKISKANKGNKNGMYGKRLSSEEKKTISNNFKELWKNKLFREKALHYPGRIENCRKGAINAAYSISKLKRFFTKPEQKMFAILKDLGYEFIHHYSIYNIKHMYVADFYIIKENLVIEVDGKYWHNYPNLRDIDLDRNKELQEKGYKILRFWEDEINKENVIENIKEVINKNGL